MKNLQRSCLVLAVVLAWSAGAGAQVAEWIWVSPEPGNQQRAHMLRLFEVDGRDGGGVARARLVATCDNHLVVYVNGEEVARSDRWETPVAVDVAELLRDGRNVLAVACENDSGPAGLALRLEITYASGEKQQVVSSGQWRVSEELVEGWEQPGFGFRAWDRAVVLGSTADGAMTWGPVMMHREATPASAVRVPEGFKVELVHSSQAGEGSWVSLLMDEHGRALVSPESGGLLRLTRTGPESVEVQRLAVDIGMCQGLLFAHDSLYASVTENANRDGGLHRLRDVDGDGEFEEHEVLARYPQRSEHGPHGLALGPDGMIYTVHGNYTPLPEGLDLERSPFRNWDEDVLLPRLWDPRGHAVNVMSPGGRVLRTDADGEVWEIVAGGMRNSYDIAFAPNGELFSYDSDMEWDIGLPWYRPPRILHVVEGGEYGWRSGSAKWPDWYPDSLPPVVETDLSSPVGVTFASGGMFPEPWASALFAGDWAYGRILAVHLTPKGASYSGEYESFVLGLPLSVTDMSFAPDGAMWFTTGGRGTQSGLYRVSYEGDEPAGSGAVIKSLTPEMELRRELEKLEPDEQGESALKASAQVANNDRFIRFAARLAVERHNSESMWAATDLEVWSPAVLSSARDLTGQTSSELVWQAANANANWNLGVEIDLVTLRGISIACSRSGAPDDRARERVLARFDGRYPSDDARMNWLLGEVLTYLRAPDIGQRLLAALESGTSRESKIHTALCLRMVVDQLDEDELDRYFTWLHGARRLSGGMSLEGFIRAIEREAMERLDEEARERVAALLAELNAAVAEGVTAAPARPFVKRWDLAGALAAVEGSGGERSLDRGRRAFAAARCVDCHRFGGSGGATGPDLTGVSRRFSRHDLLEAVVDPSKVVSDQYRASVVTMKDGRVLTGRLLQITGGRMNLLIDPYSLAFVPLNPGDIESVEDSAVSPMVPGLLDTLTAGEIADLVAYIESGGRASE